MIIIISISLVAKESFISGGEVINQNNIALCRLLPGIKQGALIGGNLYFWEVPRPWHIFNMRYFICAEIIKFKDARTTIIMDEVDAIFYNCPRGHIQVGDAL